MQDHPAEGPARDTPGGIVISNVFSDYNRGGAALTAACIEAARHAFPDRRISVIAVPFTGRPLSESHADTIQSFPDVTVLPPPYPVPSGRAAAAAVTLRSVIAVLRRKRTGTPALQRIAEADLVVSRGGYIFVERHGWAGLVALWHTAFPLVHARRLGIPTVVFASSIGPFHGRASRALNGWILRRATLVLARDPDSHRRALALGIPAARLREVPDSVLAGEPPLAEECDRVTRRLGLHGSLFGVVTVRELRRAGNRTGLVERLAETMRVALREDLVERVVIVDHVVGGDACASKDLLALLPDEQATLVRERLRPAELMALYGAARFVVGCRLHSAIFAVVAGTPAIAVSLAEAKAEGVFEEIGLGRYVVPDDFAPHQLLSLLHEVVGDGDAARDRVPTAAREARRRARQLPGLLQAAAQSSGRRRG